MLWNFSICVLSLCDSDVPRAHTVISNSNMYLTVLCYVSAAIIVLFDFLIALKASSLLYLWYPVLWNSFPLVLLIP